VVPAAPFGRFIGYLAEHGFGDEIPVASPPPGNLDAGEICRICRPPIPDETLGADWGWLAHGRLAWPLSPSRLMSRAAPVEADVASAA
jgi:hypothetical protein